MPTSKFNLCRLLGVRSVLIFKAFWIISHWPSETMPEMPSLQDVSREWEQEPDLREFMRRSRTILQWDDPRDQKVTIRNADLNFLILKPLVRRLRDDSGDVGMCALPAIMSQLLGQRLVQVHFRRGLVHISLISLPPAAL